MCLFKYLLFEYVNMNNSLISLLFKEKEPGTDSLHLVFEPPDIEAMLKLNLGFAHKDNK